jgi:hypothetical protein
MGRVRSLTVKLAGDNIFGCKVQNEQCTTCKKNVDGRVNAPSNASARATVRRHCGAFFLSNIFVSRIHPSIVARISRGARDAIGARRRAQNTNRRIDAHSAHLDDDDERRRHVYAPTTIDRSRDHTDGRTGPVNT